MRFFKTKQQRHDEEFLRGWNSVVGPDEQVKNRETMTTEEIADKIVKYTIKDKEYILLDHELKCRVEKTQNFPQYLILAAMIGGIFLGWLLSQWKPLEPKTSLDIIADHINQNCKRDESDKTKNIDEKTSHHAASKPLPKMEQVGHPVSNPRNSTPNDKIDNNKANKQSD